jgi:hypothetical protein
MALIKDLSAFAGVLLLAGVAGAQELPAPGPANFSIFLKGQQIGREQVNVTRTPDGWRIMSTGQLAAGQSTLENKHFEVRYTADWQPVELRIDALIGGRKYALNTSFGLTTAVNEITQGDTTNSKTDTISARALVVPNNFYASYEALAARLMTAEKGAQFAAYVAPQAEVPVTV